VLTEEGIGYLKGMGNPASAGALATELIGTELARWMGLRTPDFAVISVGELEIPMSGKGNMLPGLSKLILDELLGVDVERIGGLEIGAVPLIAPLAIESLLQDRPIAGFIVRKASKDHGTRKEIEGKSIKEKNVAIDDVTTQGKSALYAVEEARRAGGNVRLVLSVVDRNEGARELFERGFHSDSCLNLTNLSRHSLFRAVPDFALHEGLAVSR
jgi:orotate phosphoribosyltransferase